MSRHGSSHESIVDEIRDVIEEQGEIATVIFRAVLAVLRGSLRAPGGSELEEDLEELEEDLED